MNGKTLDWKFALTTILAIAAVVVPVYFWKADLSAYSLTVRVAASSSLELPSDSKIHDLQIVVNGTKIEDPYIYSLAIINTGSKPIPTGSFETPLQVRTLNDAKLITAQITGSEPPDIPVKISIDENKLNISPFLSNPLDEVKITLVSSGPLDLAAQARISGVREIAFEDASQIKTRPLVAIFYVVISLLSLGLYLFFLPTRLATKTIKIGMLERILSTLTLSIVGVAFVVKAGEELAYTGISSIVITLPLYAIGFVIALILERRNRALYPRT